MKIWLLVSMIFLLWIPVAIGDDNQRIEVLLQRYGKDKVARSILQKRQGKITLYLYEQFTDGVGFPHLDYVTPQSIAVDLQKIGMTIPALEALLEKDAKKGPPSPPVTSSPLPATSTLPANAFHEELLRLPEHERFAAFEKINLLQRKGCKVNHTFFQGTDSHGDVYWNIACQNGQSYVVQVRRDGKTLSRECAVLRSLGAMPCFEKFETP